MSNCKTKCSFSNGHCLPITVLGVSRLSLSLGATHIDTGPSRHSCPPKPLHHITDFNTLPWIPFHSNRMKIEIWQRKWNLTLMLSHCLMHTHSQHPTDAWTQGTEVQVVLTQLSHFGSSGYCEGDVMRVHCSIRVATLVWERGGADLGPGAGPAEEGHCRSCQTCQHPPAQEHPLSAVGGGGGQHTSGHGHSSYGTQGCPCPPNAVLPPHCCLAP